MKPFRRSRKPHGANHRHLLRSLARTLLLVTATTLSISAWAADTLPAADPAQFRACLQQLPDSAAFKPVSARTFVAYTRDLEPDASVLKLLDHQPEFTKPVWDYLATLVDDERIADGRAALAQWQDTLQQISRRFGVPPHIVVAVWGVESDFGRNLGGRPLVQSLATLSCFGRRQSYFRGELAAALRILQEGHIAPEHFNGSWAGAFGQTQFMPSTFFESAVDFDGDGRRDIVDSVPDALASTAKFLKHASWRDNERWGLEVRLPEDFDTQSASRKNRRAMVAWRSAGLRQADGSPLPDNPPAAGLLIPARGGPAFLVGRNFDAIYRYNASENYALAIALLADMINDPEREQAIVASWPTDDPGLSRAENKELQILLLARGHDIGGVDGIIGAQTRQAIENEQRLLGMKVDGRAGQKLLRALRD